MLLVAFAVYSIHILAPLDTKYPWTTISVVPKLCVSVKLVLEPSPIVKEAFCTPVAATVVVIVMAAEPSKEADPVTSPERVIVLAVASFVVSLAIAKDGDACVK